METKIRNSCHLGNHKTKSFNRKKYEFNKSSTKLRNPHHRKNRFKKEVLSANNTQNSSNFMATTFVISTNLKSFKINLLIDSGSAKSFICKDFILANRIPISGLSSHIIIQLPNNKSMVIKQSTKPLKLKIMDWNLWILR